ncbi:alpha-galactosidase A [Patella vulgata]|uniref:alpha-galactosidase A n=1 Tax=Patella vulgata TaxID=6465 RepID=UPI0024A87426|nr:alpha-galactosidase A [Patella vulgata]
MGWLSWERFLCNTDCVNDPDNCIGENLYKQMADRIVADGYKDAGYEYVCIDDCWLAPTRDANGRLQPDPLRFPGGIKALADYIHSRGLKFGIYEDFGVQTCAKFPGSEYHLQLDAQTFADWGVDLLKFDGCNSNPADMARGYPQMSMYLNQTGRPIVFSCEWPLYETKANYADIRKACNQWRNDHDIADDWSSVLDIITHYGKNEGDFASFAGPGGWNDPDELVIGDFGLSQDQEKVQMGMWAMMASPLLMSVDLRNIRNESRDLLINKRILAVNQDKIGKQGRYIFTVSTTVDVWNRTILPEGSVAVAFLNRINYGGPRQVIQRCSDLGLIRPNGYVVTDVFTGDVIGNFKPNDILTIDVNPMGLSMYTANPL